MRIKLDHKVGDEGYCVIKEGCISVHECSITRISVFVELWEGEKGRRSDVKIVFLVLYKKRDGDEGFITREREVYPGFFFLKREDAMLKASSLIRVHEEEVEDV